MTLILFLRFLQPKSQSKLSEAFFGPVFSTCAFLVAHFSVLHFPVSLFFGPAFLVDRLGLVVMVGADDSNLAA